MNTPRAATLGRIAEFLGLERCGDPALVLTGVASLAEAGATELAFVEHARWLPQAQESSAGALLVPQELPGIRAAQLVVPRPRLAFIKVVAEFFAHPGRAGELREPVSCGADVKVGADLSAGPFVTLGDRVQIGDRVTLFPGVFVGDDAVIGDDTVLHANVVVEARCEIGRRVILHGGVVIGADGFGYVQDAGRNWKVPQLGRVVIEDDVEIGANACIDRAAFGETRVQRGSKIDNLVQIAHNVSLGAESVLVAQVGVGGSSSIGERVVIGGQSGVGDHVQIGDGTQVGARSAVNRSVGPGQVVSGAPVMPHAKSVQAHAVFPLLPQMRRRLQELERKVAELEQRRTEGNEATERS